jgi:hypothetical protein
MVVRSAMLLVGLGLATRAWSAEVAVVGVHDAELGADAQHELATAIAAAIELAGAHQPIREEELAERFAGREDLILGAAFDSEGRRMLEDGRILYQQAQADEAVPALEAAVEVLAQSVATTRSVRSLWEAWMLLGTAELATGDETRARDAISAAVVLHAERRPDPAAYPPPVLAIYDEERELLADETATLVVRVPVEEAELWVDGRRADPGAELIRTITPGTHYVHARSADGRVGFAEVEVAPGGVTSVSLELVAPRLGPTRQSVGARSQQVASLYAAVGTFSKVDLVLLAGRVDGVMHLQLHAPEVGAFSQPEVLSRSGEVEEIVEGVRRLMRRLTPSGDLPASGTTFVAVPMDVGANPVLAALLMTPAPGERSGPPPVIETPVSEAPTTLPDDIDVRKKPKWPVYVGIGAGAAAVAAGVTALAVVLGRGSPQVSEPDGTLVIGPPR